MQSQGTPVVSGNIAAGMANAPKAPKAPKDRSVAGSDIETALNAAIADVVTNDRDVAIQSSVEGARRLAREMNPIMARFGTPVFKLGNQKEYKDRYNPDSGKTNCTMAMIVLPLIDDHGAPSGVTHEARVYRSSQIVKRGDGRKFERELSVSLGKNLKADKDDAVAQVNLNALSGHLLAAYRIWAKDLTQASPIAAKAARANAYTEYDDVEEED